LATAWTGSCCGWAWPRDISEELVNAAGGREHHIVGHLVTPQGPWRARLWLKPSQPDAPFSSTIDLHALIPGGAANSWAQAVSRYLFPSLVVGTFARGDGVTEAVLWERNRTTVLPPLIPGGPIAPGRNGTEVLPPLIAGPCVAEGINDQRQIVGWCVTGGERLAVLWEEQQPGQWTARELPGLGGTPRFSWAAGINATGRIGGISKDGNGRLMPTMWEAAAGTAVAAQALPLPGGYHGGGALGVSNRDHMAGFVTGDGQAAATLWRPEPERLYGIGSRASYRDINMRGDVLGESSNGAQLWATDVSIYDLSGLAPAFTPFAFNDHWWLAGVGLTFDTASNSMGLTGLLLQRV